MDKFYLDLADRYRELYKDADAAVAGSNGPYHQKETAVRNTAHWLVTFSTMYQRTGDEKYKSIIARFAQSLLSAVDASKNGAVCCIPQNRSSTNGLIGLAWVIEGLVAVWESLKLPRSLDAAEKIYFSQPYDWRLHTWIVVNAEGETLGADPAFNHSLWFCLSAAKLVHCRENDEIAEQIGDYLAHMDSHFVIHGSGLLSHFDVNTGDPVRSIKLRVKKTICSVTGAGMPWRKWNTTEYERAYHLFSMYAFALLYRFYPAADIFKNKKFLRMKAYGLDHRNFMEFSEMNHYAYGYNSPAYELPLVEYVFGGRRAGIYEKESLAQHIKYNIDPDTDGYTGNVPDAETLNARIYEIMQYYKIVWADAHGEE